MRGEGWRWFAAWVLAGGLVVLAILSGFSFGFFVLPFAALALWLVIRSGSGWPEVLGVVSGAGVVCLLIALLNNDYQPCPDVPVVLGPGETEYSCGGLDPLPWLIAGLALVVAGTVAYAIARRRTSANGPGLRLSGREKVFFAVVAVFAVGSAMTLAASLGASSSGGSGVRVEDPVPVDGP
jgi:hypothetical protein